MQISYIIYEFISGKLGKNICSKKRVSDLLILGTTKLSQMKSPFPFASLWLRREYKTQPWTNEA